ncbi:hypothetical protein [Paenibacillus sp. GCM10027626]
MKTIWIIPLFAFSRIAQPPGRYMNMGEIYGLIDLGLKPFKNKEIQGNRK